VCGLFPTVNTSNSQLLVNMSPLLHNAPSTGTFSSGAQTAGNSPYFLNIQTAADSDVVIDNLAVYRQDAAESTEQPPAWSKLESLPYPRLGKYLIPLTLWEAQKAEGVPLLFPLDQIESRLAFNDVIVGQWIDAQTQAPDSIRRIRALNPNAVILPYRVSAEQQPVSPPVNATVSLAYQFWQGVSDKWFLTDSKGNYVISTSGDGAYEMNTSPFASLVNGQSYFSYLLPWLDTPVFSSGLWDGIFFDNLFARATVELPNLDNPGLFDVDYNPASADHESIAWVNDTDSQAITGMLQQFRATHGDLELIVGNGGWVPEPSLGPYVNGYVFECWNRGWGTLPQWRAALDLYRAMQAAARRPRINVLEACGSTSDPSGTQPVYGTPTAADIQAHRFALGTTLLSDGFYSYDLHSNLSPPLWYDEYSVDYPSGVAVEDRSKKGYLGKALSDAAEMAAPGSLALQEDFESGILPKSFTPDPSNPTGASISITSAAGEAIAGRFSMVIANPDHTRQATTTVNLYAGSVGTNTGSYVLSFDYRILETFDGALALTLPRAGVVRAPFVLAGQSGSMNLPFTISATPWGIPFQLSVGGGKVAIDNVRIVQGGVGPWRRDFEYGFVLVNPLAQPHTFSAADLAGNLNRTGIRRINGKQAPDVNNGQPVTDSLTLGPSDAIILLSDPIHWSTPSIGAVSNAASGQPGVASGSFVSIYGSNFTPLAYDDWSKSITNGQLPTQLDGVSVTIGGKPAYINAVTPGQINVQAPDVGDGSALPVVVTTPGGTSAVLPANSQLYSPAFFQWPNNQPVATHADYTFAVQNGTFPSTSTIPAKPGEVIILWGTGFGPTNPTVPAGQVPAVQAPPTQAAVIVTLGGTSVPVLGAVLSAYAATYQIAIQIPASMANGNYALMASVNGVQSPSNVLLTVQH
jgi:uncharacterized protein (TIGR03437 family)